MLNAAFISIEENILSTLLYVYLAIEVIFYFIFHFHFVPKANEWVEPQPYRDYGKDRCRIVVRILTRVAKLAQYRGQATREGIRDYILGCFDPITPSTTNKEDIVTFSNEKPLSELPGLRRLSTGATSSTLSSNSSQSSSDLCSDDQSDKEEDSQSESARWTIQELGRADLENLLCWACFGKKRERFLEWEEKEMTRTVKTIEERYGLYFEPGSTGRFKARNLSLDDGNSLHRPLLVYLIGMLFHFFGSCVLRMAGFRRTFTSNGLVGWYRSPRNESAAKLLPYLFFHGIAPGCLFFYTPALLFGLFNDGRAQFLFELPNITWRIGFHVLGEKDFVEGVAQLVNSYLPKDQPISLVGHSFGSVPMTWLLHSSLRSRIRHFVLLDPVTLKLSQKDVMVNFLYTKKVNRIRILAGSELFTEYYLRRHFFFYNSELWLEDIPQTTHSLIFLAEKDEIVNAADIKELIDYHKKASPEQKLKLTYWKGANHGHWIGKPSKWREIKESLLEQELSILQEMRL
ncbi:hypothetical protein FisN_5Hh392 [Fistulifera solaris]|jgi:pimeloyl-ACP methyl ester carboxylesterase|uniref:AB hydrolase-1 domain-containing protein n=1 Tax=Fistulifera solaris TaxID=1519565 RepID=A0A1Z5JSL0_FISSO|nr:hypothetical protein FisN_5Hh392 [Fistulifera solaris]|eukprot:GAX17010.1 hypothetical protein FisN_5Hh392 [Fistulifera solaris]